MDRLKKAAILTTLTRKLLDHDSWCGETHLQKAVYLLLELFKVPMDFKFILYRHGPFSFDLRDEITSLRADGLLRLEPQPYPYGPKLVPDEQRCVKLKKLFPLTLKKYDTYLDFIAQELGGKNVTELEHIATALYVTTEKSEPKASVEKRSEELRRLKPHFSVNGAKQAVDDIDKISKEANSIRTQ